MTEKIQILFVDDEPGLLEIGKIYLEDFNDFLVTTADSAENALRFLSILKFDAIIADYDMKNMDGIELLVHLRSSGDTTPYIVFTGKGREEVVIEALNNGADFYIQKGSDPTAQFTELAHQIRYAVSQRRMEKELSESLKRTAEIINFLPDATFAIDQYGVVIAWNLAIEEMTDISREDMLGQGDHAFTIPFYGIRRKELLDLIDMDDAKLRSNYQSFQKKGHTLYAEGFTPALYGGKGAYVMVTAAPLFDLHGNRVGAIESIRDITERKLTEDELLRKNEELIAAYTDLSEAEGKLRQQYNTLTSTEENLHQTKEFLENLISIANVPIIVWEPSFRITRLNHAFELLIGRPAEEVIGKSLEFLFPPQQATRSMRLFQTTLDGVRWETVEIDIMHRDGTLRTLLWNSSTLYKPDGVTPVATIAQGDDITEQRRLEKDKNAALIQIQQNLAQLAILNDGIRNPLTIIITYADMLGDSLVNDQIMVQAQRIDMMVNQLDKRWMESQKVLNAIRKHYQIQSVTSSGPDRPDEADIDQPGTLKKNLEMSGKKTEILIEEVQSQLYTILDSIDALVYVADMDTHEILFINRLGLSLYGEVIGKKCYESIQKGQDGPCSYCTNHRLRDQSGPAGIYRWEFQNAKTGRWYDCRDRAIYWNDGRLVRLEIATDITRRKQMEERLWLSEEQNHAIYDQSPIAIELYDDMGTLRHVNPACLKLFGIADIRAVKNFSLFTDPNIEDEQKEKLNKGETIHYQGPFDFDKVKTLNLYSTIKEGIIWLDVLITPLRNNARIITGFLVHIQDITWRKQAEQALKESKGIFPPHSTIDHLC